MGMKLKIFGMVQELESWIIIGWLDFQSIISLVNIFSLFQKVNKTEDIFVFQGHFYNFQKETYLWSISKQKWMSGPKLPLLLGVEEGCLTVLNRTLVLVVGITHLQGN